MALKVLSNITVPLPRTDDTENDLSYGTDAATRNYVDDHSGGGGGVSTDFLGASEWVQPSSSGYSLGDYVVYEGNLYKSKQNSNTYLPTNSTYWDKIQFRDVGTSSGNIPVIGSNNKLSNVILPVATQNGLPGAMYPNDTSLTVYSDGGVQVNKNTLLANVVAGHDSSVGYQAESLVYADGRIYVSIASDTGFAVHASPGSPNYITGKYIWVDNSLVQRFVTVEAGTTTSLSNITTNWLVKVAAGVTSTTLTLPQITPSNNNAVTVFDYEMILRCEEGSGNAPTVSFKDSNNNDIIFLDPATTFDRGYNHFLVFRNFPAKVEGTTITRQWVANVQGKVPIPTS